MRRREGEVEKRYGRLRPVVEQGFGRVIGRSRRDRGVFGVSTCTDSGRTVTTSPLSGPTSRERRPRVVDGSRRPTPELLFFTWGREVLSTTWDSHGSTRTRRCYDWAVWCPRGWLRTGRCGTRYRQSHTTTSRTHSLPNLRTHTTPPPTLWLSVSHEIHLSVFLRDEVLNLRTRRNPYPS